MDESLLLLQFQLSKKQIQKCIRNTEKNEEILNEFRDLRELLSDTTKPHTSGAERAFDESAIEMERLKRLRRLFHMKEPSALCLSGGGIRSASFGLGVMQGLAQAGVLGKFDYLSTVSGGGYIGSWFTAWVQREGRDHVVKLLKDEPDEYAIPEPKPIQHLRDYSNYLTPKLGLFSADTWAVVAIYLRNLFLTWLVIVPLLMALLAIPRLCVEIVQVSHRPLWLDRVLLGGGLIAMIYALTAMWVMRPSLDGDKHGSGHYWLHCLSPLIVSGICLTTYWSWLIREPGGDEFHRWNTFFVISLICQFSSWAIARFWNNLNTIRNNLRALVTEYRLLDSFSESSKHGEKDAKELAASFAASLLFATLLYGASRFIEPGTRPLIYPFPRVIPDFVFVSLAFPIYMLAFLKGAFLFVGLISSTTDDMDREWWARSDGHILTAACAWAGFSSLVLLGQASLELFESDEAFGWITTAVGIASGFFTLKRSFGGDTRANRNAPESWSESGRFTNLPLYVAAAVFCCFLVVMLSMLNEHFLTRFAACSHFGASSTPGPLRAFCYILMLIGLAFLVDCAIENNRFSLHSMYRNRLIRAYLGASRVNRIPNRFTGFDEKDNLDMHELRRELLSPGAWTNLGEFNTWIRNSNHSLSQFLNRTLSQVTREQLDLASMNRAYENQASADVAECLSDELNDKLIEPRDSRPSGSESGTDKNHIQWLEDHITSKFDETLVNRLRFEEACKNVIGAMSNRGPLHIVNIALNTVSTKDLSWQQRKAQSFTVSPLHSGNWELGYRRSREYANGITLGTAVTISGAAASPNMGYHSSPLLSFLMTLFNLRLGWWMGNPGKPGNWCYKRHSPRLGGLRIIMEALGLTTNERGYVYLSDGGHFENLGLYEMVLRRCKFIVVVDAGCDKHYAYEDLGNAVRKIRIDLGISIEFKDGLMMPDPPLGKERFRRYCAIGKINYKDVDGRVDPGTILYIKPIVLEDAPADVRNYQRANKDFPHESTTDQWFSESQFESYRELGEHAITAICQNAQALEITELFENANKYLCPAIKHDTSRMPRSRKR